jgi:putative hydrolase of the HAD superfamily
MTALLFKDHIKYILFDWDGTLRHSRPSFNDSFYTFVIQAGFPAEIERKKKAQCWLHYYWAQSPELLVDIQEIGDLDDPFWLNHARLHLRAYGCKEDQAELLAPSLFNYMQNIHDPQDWVPEDIVDTLQVFKDLNFVLAVVSNRMKSYDTQLVELGLDKFFEFALAGGEVNAWKPDPAIFQFALEMLDARPADVIYIGDNYFADVVGAEKAGIQAVLIDPERIFPQANCPVIGTMRELLPLVT